MSPPMSSGRKSENQVATSPTKERIVRVMEQQDARGLMGMSHGWSDALHTISITHTKPTCAPRRKCSQS